MVALGKMISIHQNSSLWIRQSLAAVFECGNKHETGEVQLIEGTVVAGVASALENEKAEQLNEKTLEELLAELDSLIGLQNVKKHIRDQITLINFNKMRKEQGVEDDSHFSLHSVAIGNTENPKQH